MGIVKLSPSSTAGCATINASPIAGSSTNALANAYSTILNTGFNSSGTTTNQATYKPYTYYPVEFEVVVLGKKFITKLDSQSRVILAQIDFNGIGFYKSLKNMSVEILDEKITEFLDSKLKSWERNERLKNIIDEK